MSHVQGILVLGEGFLPSYILNPGMLFSGNRPKNFMADQQSRQHVWVCVWQHASMGV